jgi:hypothetical protein
VSRPPRSPLEEVSRPTRPRDIPYAITFWGVDPLFDVPVPTFGGGRWLMVTVTAVQPGVNVQHDWPLCYIDLLALVGPILLDLSACCCLTML